MRKSILKWFLGVLACLFVMLACAVTAFAANWDGECYWDHTSDQVICRWDKCEGAKEYYLIVYKGGTSTANVIYGPEKFTGRSHNVTNHIIKKGSGTYFFEVNAIGRDSGGNLVDLGNLSSEDLVLESADISSLKKNRDTTNQTIAASDGWHEYPNNTWTYGKGNNTLAKNEWLNINGKWYHFGSKGYMDKGWIQVNGAYYYLDPTNGYMWSNCTTPDGYTLNAEGVRVDNGGTPVTGSAVNATVTVTLTETGENGKVKNAAVTGVSNANLVGWTFSVPYEQWTVGNPVKLYVQVTPNNGFPFNKNSKFSCSAATYKTFYGSNPTVVEYDYYPKMKLTAPTNLTVDSANVVKWTAVPNAQSYNVRIYNDGTQVKTFTVDTNYADIGDYIDEYGNIDVGVIAVHNRAGKSSTVGKYYTNSDETKLKEVSEMINNGQTSEGRFVNSNGDLYYKDENDEKVKGWKQIQGSWYHFDNTGRAHGPGWWKDADGNWYYFNNEHKMMTGTINDGKGDYFMNDGSNSSFPMGAWVH